MKLVERLEQELAGMDKVTKESLGKWPDDDHRDPRWQRKSPRRKPRVKDDHRALHDQ